MTSFLSRHFNIIFASTPRSCKFFRIKTSARTRTHTDVSHLCHGCYMHHQTHSRCITIKILNNFISHYAYCKIIYFKMYLDCVALFYETELRNCPEERDLNMYWHENLWSRHYPNFSMTYFIYWWHEVESFLRNQQFLNLSINFVHFIEYEMFNSTKNITLTKALCFSKV